MRTFQLSQVAGGLKLKGCNKIGGLGWKLQCKLTHFGQFEAQNGQGLTREVWKKKAGRFGHYSSFIEGQLMKAVTTFHDLPTENVKIDTRILGCFKILINKILSADKIIW